jgi:GTP-sensing pleiotropic transcriptional regulator CodY
MIVRCSSSPVYDDEGVLVAGVLVIYAGQQREQEHTDRQAIVASLDVSAKSCSYWERNHIANILTKLDAHSQLQAVVFALRYDLVKIR